MSFQATTVTVFLDTLGGRYSAPRHMNADLAFHEMEKATTPRPGLLSRLGGLLSQLLAPRDMIAGVRGISPHMLRDLGLDPVTGFDAAIPAAPPRTSARMRPVMTGAPVMAGY